MVSAKDLRVVPIDGKPARDFIRRWHYSGTVAQAQWLYLGVRLSRRLVGVLSFGQPIDNRKSRRLVGDTAWDGFCELGRFAMIDDTPPNSESRALSVALRLIRQHYPYIEWVQTFADAAQCGDGTIYRACGFLLTGIKRNNHLYKSPDGTHVISELTITAGHHILADGKATTKKWIERGYELIPGFQLRYVKFLRSGQEHRLTVPVLPYSEIARRGAGMYRGRPKDSSEPPGVPARRGQGSTDPDAPISPNFTEVYA